jgi:hypothetical protein
MTASTLKCSAVSETSVMARNGSGAKGSHFSSAISATPEVEEIAARLSGVARGG